MNLYGLKDKARREEPEESEGDGIKKRFMNLSKDECAAQLAKSITQLKKKNEAQTLRLSCYRVHSNIYKYLYMFANIINNDEL